MVICFPVHVQKSGKIEHCRCSEETSQGATTVDNKLRRKLPTFQL